MPARAKKVKAPPRKNGIADVADEKTTPGRLEILGKYLLLPTPIRIPIEQVTVTTQDDAQLQM